MKQKYGFGTKGAFSAWQRNSILDMGRLAHVQGEPTLWGSLQFIKLAQKVAGWTQRNYTVITLNQQGNAEHGIPPGDFVQFKIVWGVGASAIIATRGRVGGQVYQIEGNAISFMEVIGS
jgi:hypothetical protein